MNGDSLVTYVSRSELRSTLLRAVERDPRTTAALHADLDVSQSGVYKTLDELADRGVLDAQVVVDDRLVDEAIERYTDGAPACIDERVPDLPFSFTVTADLVALSLPTRDGVSALDAVLVGSGEGAVELGRDIHAHLWERAVPVEDYLATV